MNLMGLFKMNYQPFFYILLYEGLNTSVVQRVNSFSLAIQSCCCALAFGQMATTFYFILLLLAFCCCWIFFGKVNLLHMTGKCDSQ